MDATLAFRDRGAGQHLLEHYVAALGADTCACAVGDTAHASHSLMLLRLLDEAQDDLAERLLTMAGDLDAGTNSCDEQLLQMIATEGVAIGVADAKMAALSHMYAHMDALVAELDRRVRTAEALLKAQGQAFDSDGSIGQSTTVSSGIHDASADGFTHSHTHESGVQNAMSDKPAMRRATSAPAHPRGHGDASAPRGRPTQRAAAGVAARAIARESTSARAAARGLGMDVSPSALARILVSNALAGTRRARARSSAAPGVSDAWVDASEPVYCVCRQVAFGDMIACDNEDCPVEWYHCACVGVHPSAHTRKQAWYCPACTMAGSATE